MKRKGFLIQQIADTSNLFYAYYKAVKSKRAKPDAVEYTANLDSNIYLLQQQLLTGNVSAGNYTYFKIYDPKERIICAAPFAERVMHHAIINVCHPYFERHLIYHTYATRPGKGTYAALDRAKLGVHKFEWYAKLDIRKYFNSISHTILLQQLQRLFKDKVLISNFERIIDSYHYSQDKGVPIGNLSSQYFANHYLSAADHYATDKLKTLKYIRYMDDILIFDSDKEALVEKVDMFSEFVEQNLELEFKLKVINRTAKGVPFLGYRIFPENVRLNSVSKKRFWNKLKLYDKNLKQGLWNENEYSRHILPLVAFTQHANAKDYRRSCMLKL